MKRKGRPQIITLFALLGIFAFLYFFYGDRGKHFQWYENYRADSDQPYGTLFLQKMLAGYRPGSRFILNEKNNVKEGLKGLEDPVNTDYILIGPDIFLDSGSIRALARFLDAGGDALIATLTPPVDIIKAVNVVKCHGDIQYDSKADTAIHLNFFHPALNRPEGFAYAFRFGARDFPYHWKYFNRSLFCDSAAAVAPLGYQEEGERVNFVRMRVGKGNLFLHCNPLVFTNYFLTQAEKVGYASAVFSHLGGKDIIWDEYSKIAYNGRNDYNSPLYYILQQPALRYAWWLLLAGVVLYIFFSTRRRQRVIPVLESKTNTSLEFVNLMSRLYYKNGSHVDMARKKMKYFLYFVRSKYGIHAEGFSEAQILRLAEKSGVEVTDVRAIFLQYALIDEKFRDYIEVNRLVDLHDSIENFYKQCK